MLIQMHIILPTKMKTLKNYTHEALNGCEAKWPLQTMKLHDNPPTLTSAQMCHSRQVII